MKPYFTEVVKSRFRSQVAFLSQVPIMSTILSILLEDIQFHLNEVCICIRVTYFCHRYIKYYANMYIQYLLNRITFTSDS